MHFLKLSKLKGKENQTYQIEVARYVVVRIIIKLALIIWENNKSQF